MQSKSFRYSKGIPIFESALNTNIVIYIIHNRSKLIPRLTVNLFTLTTHLSWYFTFSNSYIMNSNIFKISIYLQKQV